jgi:hypothetical protein
LAILATDGDWANAVEEAIRDALESVVRDRTLLEVGRSLPEERDPASRGPHTVVVFLADARSRGDAELLGALEAACERAIPVLPVVHAGADIFELLPPIIRPLNAIEWTDAPARAVQAVLRLLGLIERERKLFLSYRRNEASALALQLRRALGERSYDVFLDRFSVPPADDFQQRLDVELSNKAFVLVLESPSATDSEWVQHEVTFALSHQISLLALVLPNTSAAQRHVSIPDSLRHPLGDDDLDEGGELRSEALGRVLDVIESSYAAQLRRRRTGMLATLRDWLDRASADPGPTENGWALAASWPAERTSVFLITPRAPTPRDLHELDRLRVLRERTIDTAVEGMLAFGAPVRDADDERVIAWICDRRTLAVRPHLEVKEVLGV